jgi:hypothetical protein
MASKSTLLKRSSTPAAAGTAGNTLSDGQPMMPNTINGSLIPLSTIAKRWITGWPIERWTQGSFFPTGFFNAPYVVCGLLVLVLLLGHCFSFMVPTYLFRILPVPCLELEFRSPPSSPYSHVYPIL